MCIRDRSMNTAQDNVNDLSKIYKETKDLHKGRLDAAKAGETAALNIDNLNLVAKEMQEKHNKKNKDKRLSTNQLANLGLSREVLSKVVRLKGLWEKYSDGVVGSKVMTMLVKGIVNKAYTPEEASKAVSAWTQKIPWKEFFPQSKIAEAISDFTEIAMIRATLGGQIKRMTEVGNLNMQESAEGKMEIPLDVPYAQGVEMLNAIMDRVAGTAILQYHGATDEDRQKIAASFGQMAASGQDDKSRMAAQMMLEEFGITPPSRGGYDTGAYSDTGVHSQIEVDAAYDAVFPGDRMKTIKNPAAKALALPPGSEGF